MYFTTQALQDGAIVGILAWILLMVPCAAIAGAVHILRTDPYHRQLKRRRAARRKRRQARAQERRAQA